MQTRIEGNTKIIEDPDIFKLFALGRTLEEMGYTVEYFGIEHKIKATKGINK